MKQPRPGDLTSNQNPAPTRIPNISELDMITLPRDVLKWIQSLDLSYSIKNVKKDFNNGFLIAQIISRYHPRIVQMHSIDNGFSNDRKRDNWILIGKYLKEINEPNLKNENIEIYVKNENNEILFFILKLYQELSKRKVPIMEGNKFKTDQDDINRSYLLKETGEIELLKKDAENTEKRSEEIQKSLKTNTTVLSQYKTNNVIMKGDLKPISNNIFDISEKKFNPKISEAKVFERSTKILRQSKDVMLTNDINNKSPLLNKNNTTNVESQNAGTRIALSELISMQEKKDEDKSSKVKNPFEWFEESIQKKLMENHKYVMSRFKIQNNLFYDFFKNINLVSTEALALVMNDINKMIDEYYNFLSEQVNEYVSIFLLIFECYISIDLDDDKFKVLHDALIIFFIKSLKNRSEEMIYIFKNILIKKIFEAMINTENREKLIYLCEIIYNIMDPTDAQQVEFFKMFKDYLNSNEEILYECFSILHDLIPNYSEALMDICLFYILSGISHISADIRYHSLYILHKYILLNVNFFYNFEPKLKKLSISEKDRENNLIIIKTSLLFLKHNYQNKSKPKDPAVKKTTFLGFENRFDEDTANANYFNELSLGNEIIKNILKRYIGDSLFMLIACSNIAEYLNDNIDLNKIFLSALFQANEVIFNYVFYPGTDLTDEIIKLQQFTKFRVKPEYQKFQDWHYHYLCQALNSLIEEREKSEHTSRPLSEKEYKFIQFTIAPGFNPLQSEIWKSSFKFSKLLLLDCYDKSRSERALKILEAFLFFEPIQKQVLEDIYDYLQDMITRLLENKEDPVNKRVLDTLNHTLRSWSQHPNSSSILRDGLRKLIDLFVANINTNGNPTNNNNNKNSNINTNVNSLNQNVSQSNNHLNINYGGTNVNNTNTNNSFAGAGGVNSNISLNNYNSANNNSFNMNKDNQNLNFSNANNFANNSQMNVNNSFNGTNIMASNNTSMI